MTAIVRAFTYGGTIAAHVNPGGGRFQTDSMLALQQPYLGKETLTPTDSVPASTTTAISLTRGTNLIHIQVQSGKTVHYEMNPPGRSIAATTGSPVLREDAMMQFGENWTMSFLEATDGQT